MDRFRKVVEDDMIKYYDDEDGTCAMIKSLYTEEERKELDKLKRDLYSKEEPLTSCRTVMIDFGDFE